MNKLPDLLIQRKPSTQEIDVKPTMQAFAESLLAQKDEEKKIRRNKKYKAAITKCFADVGNVPIPATVLVVMATRELQVKAPDYDRIFQELERHIQLNQNGYLRTDLNQNVELKA